MRHVQRLGNQGRRRTIAGSLALVSGLAMFSVARAPLAAGQLATISIGNEGGGVATTGGNSATGNSSTNTATSNQTSGGLIAANVNLGGSPTNTSTGTATVNTGPANASGNQSQTGVNQTNSGDSGTATPFGGIGNIQSVTVENEGNAAAVTGGNTAVGNSSQNTVGSIQSVEGGLVAANVDLGAGASNNSSGTANITSGPANAVGNLATTGVNQTRSVDDGSGGFGSGVGGIGGIGGFGSGAGGGPGFFSATPFQPGFFPGTVSGFGSSFDPCSGRFFPFSPFLNDPSSQSATVENEGTAAAITGGNTAVGNNSTNTATINQTASGGLIGLNLNLGSPTNNSTGTATINSGAANASGNQSTTTVNQFCGDLGGGSGAENVPFARNVITGGPPIAVHSIHAAPVVVGQAATLARTGFESGMIVVAVALVLFGMALLISARRRLSPATSGRSFSTAEWDSVVRW